MSFAAGFNTVFERQSIMGATEYDETPCYLSLAFKASPQENKNFLAFFKKGFPRTFSNYVRLNDENGSLDHFLAAPLPFIVTNHPDCCVRIARGYLLGLRTGTRDGITFHIKKFMKPYRKGPLANKAYCVVYTNERALNDDHLPMSKALMKRIGLNYKDI